jgi:hypothetical protein
MSVGAPAGGPPRATVNPDSFIVPPSYTLPGPA